MQYVWVRTVYKKEDIDAIYRLAQEYVQVVRKAKAIPLLIPFDATDAEMEAYIELCSKFIIPGSAYDVCPRLYNSNDIATPFHLLSDTTIMRFLDMLQATTKPCLGICKWLQYMNVFCNWSLRNVEDDKLHDQYALQYKDIHLININEGSFLSQVFGTDTIGVNSIHHQCIDKVWENLEISWYIDSVIEAIEHTALPWYGVQWHPECLESQQKLFDRFIAKL